MWKDGEGPARQRMMAGEVAPGRETITCLHTASTTAFGGGDCLSASLCRETACKLLPTRAMHDKLPHP